MFEDSCQKFDLNLRTNFLRLSLLCRYQILLQVKSRERSESERSFAGLFLCIPIGIFSRFFWLFEDWRQLFEGSCQNVRRLRSITSDDVLSAALVAKLCSYVYNLTTWHGDGGNRRMVEKKKGNKKPLPLLPRCPRSGLLLSHQMIDT